MYNSTNLFRPKCKLPENVHVSGLISGIAVFSVVGLLNNLCIILVVWRNKAMHNPTNFLLANNAFSEFSYVIISTTVICLVTYIENTSQAFPRSEMKKIYSFLVRTTMFQLSVFVISAVTLALLARERYNALLHPMKINRRLSKRAVKTFISIIWIIAMAFSTSFTTLRPITDDKKNWYFLLGIVIVAGLMPLIVIAVCYGKIIHGIYVSRTIFSQISSATVSTQDIQDKKNIVKMLIANTLLFAVTRLPTILYSMKLLSLNAMNYGCLVYISIFGHISGFSQPLLLIIFSKNYRVNIRNMFTSST